MQLGSINNIFSVTINNAIGSIALFIPVFLTGLIVLLIGLIIASIAKQALIQFFKVAKIEQLLKKYGVPESQGTKEVSWTNVVAEFARWFVVIVFLVPTADIWGLGQFVVILNSFLAYLPNIIIALLLLLVGFVVSSLVYDLLLASVHGVSKTSAKTIAVVGKYVVIVFAVLIGLNQLGIASDLIRILFSGIVAAVALAGGLAFGLGGKDAARDILNKLLKNL
jgi:hypothetical protein